MDTADAMFRGGRYFHAYPVNTESSDTAGFEGSPKT